MLVVFSLPPIASAAIWEDVDVSVARRAANAEPVYYRALRANPDALKQALAAAPLEFTSNRGAELLLPMPDGTMQRFEVEKSPIMAPELAARYPEIQTYRVRGLDNPAASGRLDLTPAGFHGMISIASRTIFIDPDGTGGYRSYYKQDYVAAKVATGEVPTPHCGVDEVDRFAARPGGEVALRTSGQRRVYRLVVGATGEYTQFHGGTVLDALAAIVTAINRVNEIYGRDVAIQFVLVANNDSVVYTTTDDGYTNNNGFLMLDENQAKLDSVIGAENYDIGHVFSTGDGGIARIGVTCRDDLKAQGVSGHGSPVDEVFYVDLVAHEIGHQLAAEHVFNGTEGSCSGGRVAASAVEPGSGSTIMAYAGICWAENLQNFSDATLHAWSIDQIVQYSSSSFGANCGALEATGNTSPQSVSAGADFTIPANTAFALQGSASDPDGDVLSYQWDQMDADGTATTASTLGSDLGDNPLFRSFLPKETPVRGFPRLRTLLGGAVDPGETLPTTDRSLHFRLTVRDGQSGVNEDDMVVNVESSAGPFVVHETIPGVLSGTQVISWDVAGTNTAPINCAAVDIELLTFSSDSSSYCENALETATPNDGSQTVSFLNDHGTTRGRIRVRCSDNVFFDINDSYIEVTAPAQGATDCIRTDGEPVLHGTVFNDADSNDASGGTGGGTPPPSGGGGGGAVFLLPIILGLGWAGRRFLGGDQAQP